jgi:hypothetical protein
LDAGRYRDWHSAGVIEDCNRLFAETLGDARGELQGTHLAGVDAVVLLLADRGDKYPDIPLWADYL